MLDPRFDRTHETPIDPRHPFQPTFARPAVCCVTGCEAPHGDHPSSEYLTEFDRAAIAEDHGQRALAAQETLEEYDGREEDIPAPPEDECNDTTLLTFEHAIGLLQEGHTLTAPAIRNLPEATYRIDTDGVYRIDGMSTDGDTFAAMLAANCSDAD